MSDLTPTAAILTAAFSHTPATPAAAPAPTAPPAPNVMPVVQPYDHAELTDAQGAQIARDVRDDLAKGKISQAVADARFNEMHTPLDQRVVPNDSRTEEQKLIDDHFLPAKESDFLIRYYPAGQEPPEMPSRLKEFDQSARAWIAGAEFPREHGNSLVTEIERVARTTKGMTENELEDYGYREFEKLQWAHGDKLDERLQQVARMVEVIEKKQPGVTNLLRSKGIMDTALVSNILIWQAERYWIRRKGR